MSADTGYISDDVNLDRGFGRDSLLRIKGLVVAELYGPDGELKARSVTENIVTAVGNQYYAGRAALPSSLPAQVTGFKLGTGSTTPTSSGAGAALATYLSGSNHTVDGSFPTASAGVVTWKGTWAAGEGTSPTPITEVVLVTDTLTNATSTAANTISRALLTGISAKGASDTLAVTWTHTLLGA